MKKEKRNVLFDKFQSLYHKEKWIKAKKILKKLLKEEPKNFFLWTSLSSITYELRSYKKALKHSKKAYKLNSKSPLVLWDYAGVLYMLEKHKKSRKLWIKILNYGERKIAYELDKDGLRRAKELMNDCRYRIGESYYHQDNDFKAKLYFEEHLKHRKKGISSRYMKKNVLEFLEELEEILAKKN